MADPLQTFVHDSLSRGRVEIDDDTQLVEEGILDSLLLMQLVAFIEKSYDVQIPPEDVTPENFGTLPFIRTLIARLERT